MTDGSPRYWKYSPGGVLSEDGAYQVSGRDRFSYYFRKNGTVAILPCEHFEKNGTPTVAFDFRERIELAYRDGSRSLTPDDIDEIKHVLLDAMPLMGRAVVFD
ncbi:hypothetical protein IY145_08905 [Methylosinus sp. H3A]|uniref:hypothetical protein n=1 Tax=Methylosinus sp. H3A TaxID=2785786 RepID=UPI0018C1EAE4|nr:hypothetical protein [Methylosinus sp. H3A]MBG0809497.1 hypothetical protein [Methylosinus sp. H3A]